MNRISLVGRDTTHTPVERKGYLIPTSKGFSTPRTDFSVSEDEPQPNGISTTYPLPAIEPTSTARNQRTRKPSPDSISVYLITAKWFSGEPSTARQGTCADEALHYLHR